MTLYSEINEQPEKIKNLFETQRKSIERVAEDIQKHDIRYVFLAARGTSDNAGRYANYLLGAMNGLPLALATPSLFTYYKRAPKLKNALVIGVSQSGASPDIVADLERIVKHGRLGGTGYLSILPVDQGIEHSAGASFAKNPDYFDAENIVKLAIEGLSTERQH